MTSYDVTWYHMTGYLGARRTQFYTGGPLGDATVASHDTPPVTPRARLLRHTGGPLVGRRNRKPRRRPLLGWADRREGQRAARGGGATFNFLTLNFFSKPLTAVPRSDGPASELCPGSPTRPQRVHE